MLFVQPGVIELASIETKLPVLARTEIFDVVAQGEETRHKSNGDYSNLFARSSQNLLEQLPSLLRVQLDLGPLQRRWQAPFLLGEPGDGPGQFNRPHGVWVEGGRVFVADRDNHRIQILTGTGNILIHGPASFNLRKFLSMAGESCMSPNSTDA